MVTSQSTSESLTLPLSTAPLDFYAIPAPFVSSSEPSELAVTNPAALFMSLMPSESLQLPILSQISNFGQNDWIVSTPLVVPTVPVAPTVPVTQTTFVAPTTSVAPTAFVAPTSTEAPITSDLSNSVRISVTTRPPNTLHHFTNDLIVRSVISNGVHKIESERESYEIRYTGANKPADSPIESI